MEISFNGKIRVVDRGATDGDKTVCATVENGTLITHPDVSMKDFLSVFNDAAKMLGFDDYAHSKRLRSAADRQYKAIQRLDKENAELQERNNNQSKTIVGYTAEIARLEKQIAQLNSRIGPEYNSARHFVCGCVMYMKYGTGCQITHTR